MFDPTAFENMKVVLEGAVYDRDFIGDILVINRDDIVNLANMSRTYKIEMELKESLAPISVIGVIELHASLQNLSSELLDSTINETHSGCTVNIFISFPKKLDEVTAEQFLIDLEKIWGDQRIITVTTSETVSKKVQPVHSSLFKVSFGRLIKEEQMEDLEDMVEYLIQSIQAMKIPG
ncbi:hypothetical protein QUF81_14010 [Peribacillus simplex]|uniref:Group-specific protein n=1 Tax=Peribacillus simplex TaxID=1478 RepID=A0AAW7INM2_9BACI|nr:hypothetical protein [Peribacillus simplex]AMM93523.1 hypothetical protein UP17_14445 [Peribacillus simplex]MDF9760953.1 hypothetical protein [Peribacillus simplex]MDM5294289.1 hypothetical protein [Peribacillus simplex]MDM5453242.1 hypothetical protein [Peribacillus simplex]